MMEKDILKLNEEELANIVGGTGDLDRMEELAFIKLSTQLEAVEYLRSRGICPTDHRYLEYMNMWKASHGQ